MSDLHIVKIGGSLLGSPGGMARVARWLAADRRDAETRLLLAGGGPVVDGLRAIDRANPLPVEASHWAAIRLMDANTRLLPAWLAGIELADLPDQSPDGGKLDQAILVESWLREVEPGLPGERLTPGWQTTSDAIAARLAACLGGRVTLLKHSNKTTYHDLQAAVAAGVVDSETPRVGPTDREVRVVAVPW